MKQRHLLSLKDYSRAELIEIFELAGRVKASPADFASALARKSLAMIFQKASTRTRVSFEVGMAQLGGHALFLGPNDIQLHRGETIGDTARVLSEFVHGIVARTFSHQEIIDLARHGTVPVINGLSDLLHPCQALADYFTLLERRGSFDGLKLAYVGDGNNVCHELMFAAVKVGATMSIACPAGYEPNPMVMKNAVREAQKVKGPVPEVVRDPGEAVKGAHAVYTDVWTSMGQEQERDARTSAFAGFTVDSALMGRADPSAVFMHCLPAHRGEEVTAEVLDGPQSVVFAQAGNRLHVQKAVLILLLGGSK